MRDFRYPCLMSQAVKVRCHRRGASLRPEHRGNELNKGSRWQVQTLTPFHKQRASRSIQRVGLTERVFEVRNRQRQITQLQQKKEHHDALCLWSGCVGEHVCSVRILVSQNTPSGLGFRFLEGALLRLESSHHSTVDHPVWVAPSLSCWQLLSPELSPSRNPRLLSAQQNQLSQRRHVHQKKDALDTLHHCCEPETHCLPSHSRIHCCLRRWVQSG